MWTLADVYEALDDHSVIAIPAGEIENVVLAAIVRAGFPVVYDAVGSCGRGPRYFVSRTYAPFLRTDGQ